MKQQRFPATFRGKRQGNVVLNNTDQTTVLYIKDTQVESFKN